MKAEVTKSMPEAEIATLRLPAYSEHCITMKSGSNPHGALRSFVGKQKAIVLGQFIFAGNRLDSGFAAEAESPGWPAVLLRGSACSDGGWYSIQASALSGITPSAVRYGGRHVGFIYEDAYTRYCRLCGLLPVDRAASRRHQARSVFEAAAAILAQNEFRFTDIVRTWIYLDHLLEWYDDFNTVRTSFFKETGVFDCRIPASTGIGVGNLFGTAITMDVLAVQPKCPESKVQIVASPLQKPPMEYQSAFSRAVEVRCPTHRKLIISGTAGIALSGKTLYPNDPEKQIRLTIDVIHAILESRGMTWTDLFRGIAYFKDLAYVAIYKRVASELNIPRFPLAIAHADICRHDLAFEIEADAVQICLA